MAMIIKNGLVRLNETAEHKILDYHLEHDFGIVSGFRIKNDHREKFLDGHFFLDFHIGLNYNVFVFVRDGS